MTLRSLPLLLLASLLPIPRLQALEFTAQGATVINHPKDRGRRLFAEELWKCFQ